MMTKQEIEQLMEEIQKDNILGVVGVVKEGVPLKIAGISGDEDIYDKIEDIVDILNIVLEEDNDSDNNDFGYSSYDYETEEDIKLENAEDIEFACCCNCNKDETEKLRKGIDILADLVEETEDLAYRIGRIDPEAPILKEIEVRKNTLEEVMLALDALE